MESRITGVTAPADERQCNGEGERETLVEKNKKQISATGGGPASAQPPRPRRPAICPAVLSVFPTLPPSPNIWITSHPYGKEGEGGQKKPKSYSPLIPFDHTGPEKAHHHRGDPLLRSTITTGADNWTEGGKNFCSKDAEACRGPFLICLCL